MPGNGGLKVTTPSGREIAFTRSFDAPRQAVYDALTRPEVVKLWLNGGEGWSLAVCEIDLRVGGALRYVWRGPNGEEMGLSGAFQEVEGPGHLVHTEIFDEDWTGGETLVTYRLEESGGTTTATMTILYSSEAVRDTVLESPMEDGIAASYERLEALLTARPA